MGGFPSGQRGQTVNLLQLASVVRIHLCPFFLGKPDFIYHCLLKADERTRTVNLLITNQLLCQLSHVGKMSGTYRARTCDPLLVRQVLSQLS